jgi:hypothetical protein
MTIASVFLGLAAGLLGWIFAEFFGKPFRRGLDLVFTARTELYRYANVRLPWKENREKPDAPIRVEGFSDRERDQLAKAQATYRDLGVQFAAFAETEPIADFMLGLFGRDLKAASAGFIGLSNTDQDGQKLHHQMKTVQRGLGIKQP